MKNIMDLNDRERRYLMWKLSRDACAGLDARKKSATRRQAHSDWPETAALPELDLDIPSQIKHPME